MASLIVFPVTYLFRTTGQVLGVSLSGTLLQGVLLSKLQQRIHGPNAEEVCHKCLPTKTPDDLPNNRSSRA